MSDAVDTSVNYTLDEQVGFLLRLASQRHSVIFQSLMIESLTPTQFSTLVRVSEQGEVSQNQLGRLAAMDVATIKGVVDRLKARALVKTANDPNDRRRTLISLTDAGNAIVGDLKRAGLEITEKTLAPLSPDERVALVQILKKMS